MRESNCSLKCRTLLISSPPFKTTFRLSKIVSKIIKFETNVEFCDTDHFKLIFASANNVVEFFNLLVKLI